MRPGLLITPVLDEASVPTEKPWRPLLLFRLTPNSSLLATMYLLPIPKPFPTCTSWGSFKGSVLELGKTGTHFVSRGLLSLTKFPISVEASMGDSGIRTVLLHLSRFTQQIITCSVMERQGGAEPLALILRSGWPWCWLSPLPLGTSDIWGKWRASSSAVRWDNNSPYHWGLLGEVKCGIQCKPGTVIFSQHAFQYYSSSS